MFHATNSPSRKRTQSTKAEKLSSLFRPAIQQLRNQALRLIA